MTRHTPECKKKAIVSHERDVMGLAEKHLDKSGTTCYESERHPERNILEQAYLKPQMFGASFKLTYIRTYVGTNNALVNT
jgi:hypothetical protein